MLNTFHSVAKDAPLKRRLLPLAVFLIMSGVIFYFGRKNGFTAAKITAESFFICGAVLLILPFTGKKLYWLLSMIAASVNYVFLNTLLLLFYYILFTPLALIIRLCMKLSITRKKDEKKSSMWEDHRSITDLKQYFKQY